MARAYELRPYSGPPIPGGSDEVQSWELTGRYTAVKMLQWDRINAMRGR